MTIRLTADGYRALHTAQQRRKPATRKPPRHKEADEQAAVIRWASARHDEDPERYHDLDLLHCSLNGVPMTPAQAKRAKGQGMRSGIPDLFLPVPRNGFAGLYIEMKAEGGRATPEQKDVIDRLNRLGYKAIIAHGRGEAVAALRDWYSALEAGRWQTGF